MSPHRRWPLAFLPSDTPPRAVWSPSAMLRINSTTSFNAGRAACPRFLNFIRRIRNGIGEAKIRGGNSTTMTSYHPELKRRRTMENQIDL